MLQREHTAPISLSDRGCNCIFRMCYIGVCGAFVCGVWKDKRVQRAVYSIVLDMLPALATNDVALHQGDILHEMKHIDSERLFRSLPPSLRELMQRNQADIFEALQYLRGVVVGK